MDTSGAFVTTVHSAKLLWACTLHTKEQYVTDRVVIIITPQQQEDRETYADLNSNHMVHAPFTVTSNNSEINAILASMSPWERFTDLEKGRISASYQTQLGLCEIARRCHRSRVTARWYLKVPNSNRRENVTPRKLPVQDQSKLVRLASNSRSSAPELKAGLGVNASNRTVQITVNSIP